MTIHEHPLAWRWTNPAHIVLPEDTLALMDAIPPTEADKLCRRSLVFVSAEGLVLSSFAEIVRRDARFPAQYGRDWLRVQQPDLAVSVSICWDPTTAVRTTWAIFTAHWDAFCYPSSDDVIVFPDSEGWALLYSHWEEFQFGRRLKAEQADAHEPPPNVPDSMRRDFRTLDSLPAPISGGGR